MDQHSDFRSDPWARLAGTLRSYLRIVYGTGPAARAEIRRLNVLHGSVTGPVRDAASAARFGATYRARDADLSLWVHATLVDSTLATVDAWLEPLSADRRARFYAETIPVGRLFGVPADRLPPDIDAFDAYMAAMLAPDGPVHPSATARELAAVILHPDLAPLAEHGPVADLMGGLSPAVASVLRRVPGAAVDWLLVPSIGLLPEADARRVRAGVGVARADDRDGTWSPRGARGARCCPHAGAGSRRPGLLTPGCGRSRGAIASPRIAATSPRPARVAAQACRPATRSAGSAGGSGSRGPSSSPYHSTPCHRPCL